MALTWKQLKSIVANFDEDKLNSIATIDIMMLKRDGQCAEYNEEVTETFDVEFDEDKTLIVDTRY